jgi:hypothetical protein
MLATLASRPHQRTRLFDRQGSGGVSILAPDVPLESDSAGNGIIRSSGGSESELAVIQVIAACPRLRYNIIAKGSTSVGTVADLLRSCLLDVAEADPEYPADVGTATEAMGIKDRDVAFILSKVQKELDPAIGFKIADDGFLLAIEENNWNPSVAAIESRGGYPPEVVAFTGFQVKQINKGEFYEGCLYEFRMDYNKKSQLFRLRAIIQVATASGKTHHIALCLFGAEWQCYEGGSMRHERWGAAAGGVSDSVFKYRPIYHFYERVV